MKKLYTPTYKSYISSTKRRNSELLFVWFKQAYCKYLRIPYRD